MIAEMSFQAPDTWSLLSLMKETLGNLYRALSLASRDITEILEQLIKPMCFLKQSKTEKHTLPFCYL